MINSVTELNQLISGKRKFEGVAVLPSGDYHVTPNHEYQTLRLTCAEVPYATRIYVHEAPLKVGHFSLLHQLTFIPMGDFPALVVDHSSRARILENIIRSRMQDIRDKEIDDPEDADDLDVEGIGIATTSGSYSENNWRVKIDGNLFQALKIGIDIQKPSPSPIGDKLKGTSAWKIAENDFDGCRVGLKGRRLELFRIRDNHFQVHYRAIHLAGCKSNWVRDNSFERGSKRKGAWDIFYGGDTCHMRTIDNTARKERVHPRVYDTQFDNKFEEFSKRNIDRPCIGDETGDTDDLE